MTLQPVPARRPTSPGGTSDLGLGTGGAGHRRCRRRVGAADRGDLARLRADCVASPMSRDYRVKPREGTSGLTSFSRRSAPATPPDGAQRRTSRLHGDPGPHRPRQGRLRLHRRRLQPLGPPCTGSIPHTCSAWRWRSRRQDRRCTGLPTRASRSATSPGNRAASRPPGGRYLPKDAAQHFAWLASFLARTRRASSALTRELLGWQPTQPGLIADLDGGHYFHNPSARSARRKHP